MGIFSKKKKVTVGVSAVKVIDKVTNPYQQVVLSSVFGKSDFNQVLQKEARNNFYSKAQNYYRYGKNKYVNGLPEGFKNYCNIDLIDLGAVLGRIFAQSVTVVEVKVGFADRTTFAYRTLQDIYGYDPTSLQLSKPPIVYPLNTKVTVKTITINTVNTITVAVDIQKAPLLPTDPIPPLESTTYTLPFTVNEENTYLSVKYKLVKDILPEAIRYWYYDINSNAYPELDTVLRDGYTSPFYPLVPIRQNKVNVSTLNNQLKTDVSKMLELLGLTLDNLTSAIMSTEDGNNPENIDECFVGFFANLHNPSEATRNYLWELFKDLHSKQQVTKTVFNDWYVNKGSRDTPQEALTIKEADFNIRLLWNYIDKTTSTSSSNSVGSITINITTAPRFILNDFDFEESALTIVKQVTSTQIETITVHGLEHIVDVYEGELYSTTLADLSDDDRKTGFYIPLQKDIVKKIPFLMKDQLVQDCLHIIVYAVQITYIKWYQRGFFKTLITIAAIVIAIYFGDWGSILSTGLSWTTAVSVATSIIVNMIYLEGARLFVNMVGGELAAIFAVALAIYSFVNPQLKMFGANLATDFLNLSTATIQASNELFLDEYNKIVSDLTDLTKSIKEKKEEIKEAYDMLGSADINYFDIRKGGGYFNPNETASEFFERTVYNKNPGVQVYDQIFYFYENALKSSLATGWSN